MSTNEKPYTYLQFPLCFIGETFKDPQKGLNLICEFGIVNFAMKQSVNIEDVQRQLIYSYYRKKESLPRKLHSKLLQYVEEGKIETDEDYNGFNGKEFNPEQEIKGIAEIFEIDSEFKETSILTWQIGKAAKFLKVRLGNIDNTIKVFNEGQAILNRYESLFGPDAWPSVKPSMLFDVRDSGKDLDLFRAFIGIKSMIGRRNFISSNKPAILSRMIGCKNKASFNEISKDKAICPTIEKYSKRYHMDNLLLLLVERKYIMYLASKPVSVIYLSTYMEPEKLRDMINESKTRLNIKKRIADAAASLQ
jgi:hypothetical protein